MIGLDTNVLVRYLTQDDPSQARLATDLIERRLSHQDPGFISIVAMVETAWVLERAYGLSAAEVAAVIERLRRNWLCRTSKRCSPRWPR